MEQEQRLMNAGLKKKEAQILSLFFEEDKLFSRDIEHMLRIRQPEACIALGHFVKKGWLKYKKILSKGKGRPQQLYSLKKSKSSILAELLDTMTKKKESIEQTIKFILSWQSRVK